MKWEIRPSVINLKISRSTRTRAFRPSTRVFSGLRKLVQDTWFPRPSFNRDSVPKVKIGYTLKREIRPSHIHLKISHWARTREFRPSTRLFSGLRKLVQDTWFPRPKFAVQRRPWPKFKIAYTLKREIRPSRIHLKISRSSRARAI